MNAFVQRLLTGLLLAVLFYSLTLIDPLYSSFLLMLVLLLILIFEWPQFVRMRRSFLYLTPLYPIAPFIALILLSHDPAARWLLALAIITASAHDIGSYISGNLWGRTLIAPTISPKKTWEGFAGGCVLTAGVTACFCAYFGISINWYMLLALSFMISVTAFLGDLFESFLKRKVGLKDSGVLLPGHGGFLDRFDSVMAVGLFLYVVRQLLETLCVQS